MTQRQGRLENRKRRNLTSYPNLYQHLDEDKQRAKRRLTSPIDNSKNVTREALVIIRVTYSIAANYPDNFNYIPKICLKRTKIIYDESTSTPSGMQQKITNLKMHAFDVRDQESVILKEEDVKDKPTNGVESQANEEDYEYRAARDILIYRYTACSVHEQKW
uniref:Uncharacterized protein n=1 Tax=Glossina pallidipes TaxID=7398 RepID=A0A1B0ACH5_GLOPL